VGYGDGLLAVSLFTLLYMSLLEPTEGVYGHMGIARGDSGGCHGSYGLDTGI